jgi:hypothetical protein
MKDTFRRISLMIVLLLSAGLTYAHGFWVGRFLEQRPTDEYCTEKPLSSYQSITWDLFPLKNLCQWSDGTSTELVPWYVNPIMFAFLAAATAFFALAIEAARHNRSVLRRATQGDQIGSDHSPGAPGPMTHGKA